MNQRAELLHKLSKTPGDKKTRAELIAFDRDHDVAVRIEAEVQAHIAETQAAAQAQARKAATAALAQELQDTAPALAQVVTDIETCLRLVGAQLDGLKKLIEHRATLASHLVVATGTDRHVRGVDRTRQFLEIARGIEILRSLGQVCRDVFGASKERERALNIGFIPSGGETSITSALAYVEQSLAAQVKQATGE